MDTGSKLEGKRLVMTLEGGNVTSMGIAPRGVMDDDTDCPKREDVGEEAGGEENGCVGFRLRVSPERLEGREEDVASSERPETLGFVPLFSPFTDVWLADDIVSYSLQELRKNKS